MSVKIGTEEELREQNKVESILCVYIIHGANIHDTLLLGG